jgi:hypothetical protein
MASLQERSPRRTSDSNHVGLAERIVRVAIGIVFALTLVEEVLYGWHRTRRAAAVWWAGVEHRERQQLRAAELSYLDRYLPRR